MIKCSLSLRHVGEYKVGSETRTDPLMYKFMMQPGDAELMKGNKFLSDSYLNLFENLHYLGAPRTESYY